MILFGPSLADAIVRITAYEFFPEDDKDPLVSEICRTYASKIRGYNFIYLAFLYAIFEPDFTNACEYQQTSIFNDDHISLGRKTLTTQDCMNNIIYQPVFLAKGAEIHLNGSGSRNIQIQSMDVKLSNLDNLPGTSYVELLTNHRSSVSLKKTQENYWAICVF